MRLEEFGSLGVHYVPVTYLYPTIMFRFVCTQAHILDYAGPAVLNYTPDTDDPSSYLVDFYWSYQRVYEDYLARSH